MNWMDFFLGVATTLLASLLALGLLIWRASYQPDEKDPRQF